MKLRKIFRWTQPELKKRLKSHLSQNGYNPISRDGFLYAEGELPVLLVAHLDTVHKEPVRDIVYRKGGREIWSPQGIGGDDRCGVYMILKIINELRCHVLFCEDEECGGIGADKFVASGIIPNVNFIVEMDRRGSNDAVFYDCDNPEFTDFITSFGFVEDWGTFSDISTIAPALGVAAVNISAGYYHEHTLTEYVDIEATRQNAERIKEVVRVANCKYEYIESSHAGYYGYYGGHSYVGWSRATLERFYAEEEEYYRRLLQKQHVLTYMEANRIEDVWGYVITADGEFIESDVFIGSDNKIYIEYQDGLYCCMENARAFNASGGNLRFHEECDTYSLYIS